MTKAELNTFKNILEAKHAELAQFVRYREGIAIEKCADALDEVQYATERELAIRNLDRESNLLRNVHAALRRIDGGTFGVPALRRGHQSQASGCCAVDGRSAFSVRKSLIAARPATARRTSRSHWQTRPNRLSVDKARPPAAKHQLNNSL